MGPDAASLASDAAPCGNSGRRASMKARTADELDPKLRSAVIEFLRDWLPTQAMETYRAMILADPEGWSRHPHFAADVITEHALRGNGITESVLGVESLETVWPELLREAVLTDRESDA